MKKIFATFVVISIVMLTLINIPRVNAANSTATLTGPSTVRAGDTITVTLKIGGTGILAAEGYIKYDSSKLTLVGNPTQKIAAPWLFDFDNDNGKFLAYDDKQTAPVNNTKDLFTMTFKVKDLAVGTNVEISTKDLVYSDGKADTYPSANYSFTIAAPKSTNNSLSSLTVSNATISPAFNKNTTSYTASVPFSVSKLNVSYAPEDSKSTVAINNPNLIVGTTDVSITVTAESGAKKTYTIKITRAQDPNYSASSDARLKEITLNTGSLSPVFNSDTTDYVVYVPFETNKITISGKAYDAKAQNVASKTFDLVAGDNKIVISGIAEDGSKKDYTLHVFKMPKYNGGIPDIQTGEDIEKETITGEIKISGDVEVGQTLSADVTLSPSNATVIYIWYADDNIVGSGPVYNVSKGDVGKDITVKVTGTGNFEGELTSSGVKAEDISGVSATPSVITVQKNKGVNHIVVIVAVIVGLGLGIIIGFEIKKRNIYG